MSYSTIQAIFSMCNNILSRQFTILGLTVNLWQFILFDCLVVVVVRSVLRTFHNN